MKYNPDLHNRRSIRLRNWDYSNTGAYFITICCQDRINHFGEIVNNEMVFNEYGEQAYNEWEKLSERYPGIAFDIFQIMPNHIHGIIEIQNSNVGATLAVAQNANTVAQNANATTQNANTNQSAVNTANIARNCTTARKRATVKVAPTVGRIVGAYKSLVLKKCLEISKHKNCILGKLWQRNYYEHQIRNEKEYLKITEYIRKNPILWRKNYLNIHLHIASPHIKANKITNAK